MINENVMMNQSELTSFIPETSAPVKLRGIESTVEIYRDEYGIPVSYTHLTLPTSDLV